MRARPIGRTGELLETTPGLIATQHSGGGKANQYFLRGFNLDHGTDFSVRVSGVPVNMPSHGHGQGYADLSFVIPELVDRVAYRKGPYHAGSGDGSTELSLNLGWSFHSNDARGATIRVDPVTGQPARRVEPLVPARGAEMGLRTAHGRWSTSLALFGLALDSELVFVGDGGATEASRPSRRLGVEWTNYYRINRRLALDADLTWTDAEFSDDDSAGSKIPGSIANTVSAGMSLNDLGRFSGSIRWRYFSAATYRLTEEFELRLEVLNLLDSEESDVEYYYASRFPGEPEAGVEDVHFHPAESRTSRLGARWKF